MRRSSAFWACVLWSTFPLAAMGAEIVGTKSGKVYHTQGSACASAARISDTNKVRFASIEEAEQGGRRLCKRCEDLASRTPAEPAPPAPAERNGNDTGRPPAGARATERPTAEPPPATDAPDQPPEYARVVKVLYGGTCVLDNGDKAVLTGIVCPDRGQPLAKDAMRFLTEQTCDRVVRIVANDSPHARRDALGRAIVYISQDPGGRDVAAEMLFQGYAWVDRCASHDRRSEYLRQEESAAQGQRGIWKALEGNSGEDAVVTGRHAWQYHSPKCRHVEHLCDPLSLTINEAKARRLTPCSEYRGK